jgi:hypothetical protein
MKKRKPGNQKTPFERPKIHHRFGPPTPIMQTSSMPSSASNPQAHRLNLIQLPNQSINLPAPSTSISSILPLFPQCTSHKAQNIALTTSLLPKLLQLLNPRFESGLLHSPTHRITHFDRFSEAEAIVE